MVLESGPEAGIESPHLDDIAAAARRPDGNPILKGDVRSADAALRLVAPVHLTERMDRRNCNSHRLIRQ